MPKVALVLSGCGHRDGTEITEAVSALIALSEAHAQVSLFAPNLEVGAIDHLTGKDGALRNPLHEAARIARGKVEDLNRMRPEGFDALVVPGGMGAATVLSNWATLGARCEVLPQMAEILKAFYHLGRPIGAICIAPAIVARVLGSHQITLTVGRHSKTADELELTGAHHEVCTAIDFVTDREHKIVSTPAYMYDDATPAEIFAGIRGLVREVIGLS